MKPLDRAQVLLLCDLCESAALQSHCELCQINLCKACVGEHLSDSSQRHNVVPYKHRTSTPNYPKCQNHTQKHCELYCEKCDIPVCSTCVSSDKHHGHKLTDVVKISSFRKKDLEKDLEELEKQIYPAYEKITLDLNSEKENFDKHFEKLTIAVRKQGEKLHEEINVIVKNQSDEIDEIKNKHQPVLNKNEKEIKKITSDVKQSILDLKKIVDSSDYSLISAYKSRNAEFKSLPPKVNVSLPNFSPHQINREQLHQMFGSLSAISITTEEHGYAIKTPEAVSCHPEQPLLDEPSSKTKRLEKDLEEQQKQIHLAYEEITLDLNSDKLVSITTEEHSYKIKTPEAVSCHPEQPLLDESSSKTKGLEKDLEEQQKQIHPAYEEITLDLNSDKRNSITREEHSYAIKTPEAVSCSPVKPLLDEPSSKTKGLEKDLEEQQKQIHPAYEEITLDLNSDKRNSITREEHSYAIKTPETVSCSPVKPLLDEPSSKTKGLEKDLEEQQKQIHPAYEEITLDLNSDKRNSITREEHSYAIKTPEAVSCSPVKPLLDKPKPIATINTGYNSLYSVTCLSDEEIWTRGNDKIMKLFNLQGKVLMSIKTKSGNVPSDIAVTRNGDLVYTDKGTRTVNIVKNEQIQEMVRLQGWKPSSVCSTCPGDLLVTMDSDDKQSKVVRYSGSTEKQTIQFDCEGKPLYSSNYHKCITENRNLDICVADWAARAVVVVNREGKLRFLYTGDPSTKDGQFYPCNITTDSLSQILTADHNSHCIHIIDQDGKFLRKIGDCDLSYPYALCVDTRDNLFVAEYHSGKVKKIKYM